MAVGPTGACWLFAGEDTDPAGAPKSRVPGHLCLPSVLFLMGPLRGQEVSVHERMALNENPLMLGGGDRRK